MIMGEHLDKRLAELRADLDRIRGSISLDEGVPLEKIIKVGQLERQIAYLTGEESFVGEDEVRH